MTLVFTAASVLSATLVFAVQPLAARMVLPDFGGSAAVWTTSVLFFQVVLLAGYLYTHVATNRLAPRPQVGMHLAFALVPLLVLPLAVTATPGEGGTVATVGRLLAGLTLGVGLPFLLVSTSGPLLQRWLSWTDHPRAADPYFLYAASNVGSMVGLLSYPLVVEPLLAVRAQAWAWSGGYVLLLALLAGCAWFVRHAPDADGRDANGDADGPAVGAPPVHPGTEPGTTGTADAPRRRDPAGPADIARWVGLAFVPSSLMLGTTTLLTTDIASVPLLWVVPLALYLATFVVAFGTRSAAVAGWSERLVAPLAVLSTLASMTPDLVVWAVVFVSATFAVVAMVFHHRLAASRPDAAGLTGFYVWMSVGGALGGVANAVIAPLVLPGPYEFLLVAAAAALVAGRSLASLVPPRRALAAMSAILLGTLGLVVIVHGTLVSPIVAIVVGGGVALALALTRLGRSKLAMFSAAMLLAVPPAVGYLVDADIATRSFFGSYRVTTEDGTRRIFSGSTLHGVQSTDPARTTEPLSYYHASGPIGDWLPWADDDADIGVIGLGAGTLATYTRPGDRLRYHEIDPTVVALARSSFTFLDQAPGEVDVVLGDGRLTLDDVPDDTYDALLVDAFTSDAIPVHLLTEEAFAVYDRVVAPDGVLLVHISNRYVDLEGVVAAGAESLGARALVGSAAADDGIERPGTTWVAISHDDARFRTLDDQRWRAPTKDPVRWTDDYSNILSVLRG